MPTTYIEPLNLREIFLNYFLGSTQLFMFAFIIIFSLVCAKYQMSNRVYFVLLAISSIIMAGFLGQSIYVLIIFVIGLVSFKGIGAILT
jgi:hypothetical protein